MDAWGLGVLHSWFLVATDLRLVYSIRKTYDDAGNPVDIGCDEDILK